MTHPVINLYDYHAWANGKVLEHLRSLPEEVMHHETDDVFKSISEALSHIVSVDHVWFSRLKGESPGQIAGKPFGNLDEAAARFEAVRSTIEEYLRCHWELLDQEVTYSNTKGQLFHNTAAEIIQHIVNHGTYHRGNVTSMLRRLGHKGTSTDYIEYLRSRG